MSKGIINTLINKAKDHSPELLISAGVGGMITATILAVAATPKAMEKIEDRKADMGVTYLTKKETIQAAWKPYIPAAGLTLVSTACIMFGTTQNIKRNTALATVYAVSENTLREYQRKTIEVVGEEKAREIETEVAKARVRECPIIVQNDDSSYVSSTGDGDTLIFDTLSGRYFRSSMNAIDRAVNNINKSLLNERYMTLNDLYNELNIPTIDAGSMIGWNAEYDMLDVAYDSDVDRNGQPFLILSHRNRPIPIKNRY